MYRIFTKEAAQLSCCRVAFLGAIRDFEKVVRPLSQSGEVVSASDGEGHLPSYKISRRVVVLHSLH